MVHLRFVFLNFSFVIASSLSDLFNFSVGTKTYPDDFKVAKVTPIFKSGDKDDVNN